MYVSETCPSWVAVSSSMVPWVLHSCGSFELEFGGVLHQPPIGAIAVVVARTVVGHSEMLLCCVDLLSDGSCRREGMLGGGERLPPHVATRGMAGLPYISMTVSWEFLSRSSQV